MSAAEVTTTAEHQWSYAGSYLLWLSAKIVSVSATNPSKTYSLLLERMFNTPFYWSVPMDENRAIDGLDLRREFLSEHHLESGGLDHLGPCSFLEMLIALCSRMDFQVPGDIRGRFGVAVWFHRILENMRLREMTDEAYMEADLRWETDEVLARIMNRQYNYNGGPGMFPLEDPPVDQRGMEIWYQASMYMIEISESLEEQ